MDKKSLTLVLALSKIAQANAEGFTVDRETLQPVKTGFAVAVSDTQNSFGFKGLCEVVKYVLSHPETNAFGGWYNSANKQFYFDATMIVNDKKTAIELGRINNQISIFDLNNMEEITL